MTQTRFLFPLIMVAVVGGPAVAADAQSSRPNIVLMMSDDQGWGDFGVNGNPIIETPNIDAMAKRSASMSTFYVCPVCSPTRACLMTGRYNYRTRCIDTYLGRSMMDSAEVTIAEVLRAAGYATGIFGKWHLGDCYPLRAIDQGFEEALVIKGGGLAQASDPLENDRRYTNPILMHNGQPVQTDGYCTDVYFDAAMKFIEESQQAKRPFFAYVPTNAPHGPYHDVPQDLYEHYRDQDFSAISVAKPGRPPQRPDPDTMARIAAMITNIDQNVGRMVGHLDRLGLTDNTIVIYMIDNGPQQLRYVGPFRSSKGNVLEGGVRSPFWIQWPARLKAGASSSVPVAHIDVMSTLLDACGVEVDEELKLDGRSFLPLLEGKEVEWPERYLALQAHRGNVPVRYHHFMIRDNRWKLVHPSGFGNETLSGPPKFELYDLLADPGELNDLAAERPEEVERLRAAYDEWFDDVSNTRPDNYAPPRIIIGTPHENPTVLTQQDWRVTEKGGVGHWEVELADPGPYDVELQFSERAFSGQVEFSIGNVTRTTAIDLGARSVHLTDIKPGVGPMRVRSVVEGAGDVRAPSHIIITRR